ncbi:MAG: lytic transglycosylase domain-containing protein [Pseudobdellovibrionaceae bacterium]
MIKKIILPLLYAQCLFSFQISASIKEEKKSESETPVSLEELFGAKLITEQRPWRAPDYSGQSKALGYGTETSPFVTPKGLESNVQFWIDVYSKYSTSEGVIHDSENIDLVYEVVDFSEIEKDINLNTFQKEKAKQKKVDFIKKDIVAMLKKFETVKSVVELSDKEKKIWKYFEKVDEPNKFHEAAQKNRMRFQLGQKDRMQKAIFLSGRYIEEMEDVFTKQNLPKELVRLVFVESSFNILARSKVGASGLWQIMPYSARPYRMIQSAVDKRNHPLEATRFAAKMLASNYRMLESWPLAATGYNHGPTGVRKMTQKYKTRDLGELVQNVRSRKSFGFASRNFYATFLAALEVEKNAKKYFQNVWWSKKLPSEDLKIPVSVGYNDLLGWFDEDDQKVQVFNPHLTLKARQKKVSIPAGTVLHVPQKSYDQILISLTKKSRGVAAAETQKKSKK